MEADISSIDKSSCRTSRWSLEASAGIACLAQAREAGNIPHGSGFSIAVGFLGFSKDLYIANIPFHTTGIVATITMYSQ